MIKVLLADRQQIVREGLKAILESYPDFQIVGETTSLGEVLIAIKLRDIDVLIVDLACFQPDSIAALWKIAELTPKMGVYVLTDDLDMGLARQAIAAGALGYCCKGIETSALVAGVRLIAAGRPSISEKLAEHLATELHIKKFGLGCGDTLSPRENSVYLKLINGESNKSIAHALQLSAKTVATHKSRILAKLNVDCMSRLIQHALHNGLLEPLTTIHAAERLPSDSREK